MNETRRGGLSPAPLWALAALLMLAGGAAQAFTPPRSLTVATDDNYPPYLFRGDDGKLQGITKDKWDLWSSRTGVEVTILGTAWARAQELVRQRRADILELVARTPEREGVYAFSAAYGSMDARVFFHQSLSVSNHVVSMRGFIVGAKAGSACGRWLADRGLAVRTYPGSEEVIAAALAGEDRLFCMDAPVGEHLLMRARTDEFRKTAPLYSTSLHWATAKGNEALRDFVEEGFAALGPAALRDIEQRWRGSAIEGAAERRYREYFLVALLASAAVALLMLGWNRTLRSRVAARTTELREALALSDSRAAQVRDLYNNAPCGYHSLGPDGTCVEMNDTELAWLGYSREEVVGRRKFHEFLSEDSAEAYRANFAKFLEQGELRDVQYEMVRRDGARFTVLLSTDMVRDAAGRMLMSRTTVFDITERNAAEQRIAHLAQHDALTGLPNRALLQDRLEQAIAHAHRDGLCVAVLFLDLDRFKNVNDSLGHDVGDRLLREAAARITLCLREGDTVSRHGGDEFVVVLRDLASAEAAGEVAEKILASVAETLRFGSHEVHVTASIGVSLYPADGAEAEDLLRHADAAMYHAKDAGRANYQFFTESMNVEAQRRLGIEYALRRALAANEFRLQFQPIVDLRDRAVIGFEALLRWVPQGRDPIPPGEFISIAEDCGLIVPIGEWVLREALARAREWQSPGRAVKVAINVSANQLARPHFAAQLRDMVRAAGVDPRLVELEVTEGVIVESTGGAREAIDAIHELGVNIVIDDFGTGYSGLTYLKRLPIAKVKIDQSFVRDLTIDPDDAAIVTAIVAMAHSLGVDVVAEGVETEQQALELKRLGCHRAQGFLLGRPMPPEAAASLVRASSESSQLAPAE